MVIKLLEEKDRPLGVWNLWVWYFSLPVLPVLWSLVDPNSR